MAPVAATMDVPGNKLLLEVTDDTLGSGVAKELGICWSRRKAPGCLPQAPLRRDLESVFERGPVIFELDGLWARTGIDIVDGNAVRHNNDYIPQRDKIAELGHSCASCPQSDGIKLPSGSDVFR
ncbi:hypothetical protein ACW9YQ_16075 (plasmid) [Paraburkholderia strydomiana]